MARSKRSPPKTEDWDEQLKRDAADPNSPINRLAAEAREEYSRKATKDGPSAPQKGLTKMKVNFRGVSTGFEPRKAGEYQGTLIKHEVNPASATSGQPTVKLEWSEDESPNRRMFKTYSLQPKALFAIKRDLIRMGADVEEMNSPEADLDAIVEGLYGVSSTLVFGDPRPDEKDPSKVYDNFIEIKKPQE